MNEEISAKIGAVYRYMLGIRQTDVEEDDNETGANDNRRPVDTVMDQSQYAESQRVHAEECKCGGNLLLYPQATHWECDTCDARYAERKEI